MFFKSLGTFVSRFWAGIIAFWIIAAVTLGAFAPRLSDVSSSEASSFLPPTSDSVQARLLLNRFFPADSFHSRLVLVVEKESPLTEENIQWLDKTACALAENNEPGIRNIHKVLTPISNPLLRNKLVSKDGNAAMAVLYLTSNFVAKDTKKTVAVILKRIAKPPAGITIAATGDAAVGYDYYHAMGNSASRTTWATVLLLAAILVFIFRSPVTPVLSLASIALSLGIAKSLTALCAVAGASVYPLTEIFLVVMVFGAGTDYCVFLIFRYAEELAKGKTSQEAIVTTLETVGAAISSSAFTVIIGVGSLMFTQFGPFSQTGPYIALGVAIALCAGLTLTPAVILALRKILFWPTGSLHHDLEPPAWQRVVGFVTKKPLLVFGVIVLGLSPFLYFGWKAQRSFDFLRELDASFSSRRGVEMLKSHFSPGDMSPLVLVLEAKSKLNTPAGLDQIHQLTQALAARKEIEQVLSVVWPTGDSKLLQAGLLGSQVQKINEGLGRLLDGTEKMHSGIDEIRGKLEDFDKDVSGSSPSPNKILPPDIENASRQAAQVREELDKAIAGVEDYQQDLRKKSQGGGLFGGIAGGEYQKAAEKLETLRQGLIKIREGLGNLGAQAQQVSAKIQKRQEQAKDQIAQLRDALTQLSQGTASASSGIRKITKTTQGWTDPASGAHDAMEHLVLPADILERQPKLKEAFDYYIAPSGNATRLILVLNAVPYSDQEKNAILALREFLKNKTEEIFPGPNSFHLAGSGSMMLDERIVTDRDFYRIIVYVLGGIFIVLLLLLREWLAPVYLIGTMIFSYFASLGITSLVFEHLMGLKGLDWKVSFFMFVLLVALGEDYNIFLMARIKEERQKLGLLDGVRTATIRTGPLITFCGLIMAGTFLSLMLNPLEVLLQLGFGITVGVLLDTFVVRPLLVPSLVLLVKAY